MCLPKTPYVAESASVSPRQVTAPESSDEGPARFRVNLFHRNHLLQSFVVQARIAPEEEGRDETALGATLEFPRTARFTNLDALKPRALCVGVNADPQGGHTFMLKRGGQAFGLPLSEKILEDAVAKFRGILLDAVRGPDRKPRFSTWPEANAMRSPDLDSVLRALAIQGGALHQAVFIRGGRALEKELRAIAEDLGETPVQVVRHDPSVTFPWSILYDFGLPEMKVGEPQAAVCLGSLEQPPCSHVRGTTCSASAASGASGKASSNCWP